MSVPRELGLRTIDGQPRSCSSRSASSRSLRTGPSFMQRHRPIPPGTTTLPGRGQGAGDQDHLRLGSAKQAGLKVRTGDGEETVIGYDARRASSTSTAPSPVAWTSAATSPASSEPRSPPATARSACASSSTGPRSRSSPTRPAGHHRPDLPRRLQRRGRAVRRRRQRHVRLAEDPAPALQLGDRPPHRLGQPTAPPGRAAMPLASGCTPVDDSAPGKRASPLPSNRRPLGTMSSSAGRHGSFSMKAAVCGASLDAPLAAGLDDTHGSSMRTCGGVRRDPSLPRDCSASAARGCG